MALAFRLQTKGFTPSESHTEAAVSLDQDNEGFRITRSALTLRAKVPGIDRVTFARISKEAEQTCPSGERGAWTYLLGMV